MLDVDTLSALAIENSSFSVADIADRDVSYVMLRQAGVSPLDADRLRRRYSLTWTFVWTEGAHLPQRAEQLRTLRETERAWVAARTTTTHKQRHRAHRHWQELREAAAETRPLETDKWSGGDTDHDAESSAGETTNDEGLSWAASVRQFVAED